MIKLNATFWKIRISMFIWGFATLYYFTGQIDITSKAFLVQVIGNSFIIWVFTKE